MSDPKRVSWKKVFPMQRARGFFQAVVFQGKNLFDPSLISSDLSDFFQIESGPVLVRMKPCSFGTVNLMPLKMVGDLSLI